MLDLGRKLEVDIISPDFTFLNKDLVQQLHDNHISVIPWTVNSTDDFQKMMDIKVDRIITDYPKEMRDYYLDQCKSTKDK